jgi:hypothetical protein
MSISLAKFQPNPWLARKIFLLTALVAVGAAAFCWGRWQSAGANPPVDNRAPLAMPDLAPASNTDYSRRVVAYLYGNYPITREELGEYLIARFGVERLEFMVNRKIVENEARKRNIFVTDLEVEARFKSDLNSFGAAMQEKDFVNSVLRRFGKTLFEWKEDVIRPKLMMEKIVRPLVKQALSDKDLTEGFEARYGPKVECRMIVIDKNDSQREQIWKRASAGRNAFLEEARKQFIPNLASIEGKVPPIHKHFGDAILEDAAFRLKPGDVSGVMQMKDGSWVILMCEQHIAANQMVRFEDERLKLRVEMEELRLAQKIPEVFAEMRKQANPKLILVASPQRSASIAPPPSMDRKDVRYDGDLPPSLPNEPLPASLPSVPPLALPAPPTPVSMPEVPNMAPPPTTETPPAPTKDPAPAPKEPAPK